MYWTQVLYLVGGGCGEVMESMEKRKSVAGQFAVKYIYWVLLAVVKD